MEYIVKWDGIAADITEIAGRYCYPELRKLKAERRGEPIVRCKDCIGLVETWDGWECERFSGEYHGAEPDGFCKWGVAKE